MIYVIAHNIRSLYNVGALFRLCDGVGVDRLYLTGYTGTPYDDILHQRQRRQISKTALEGLDSVDWEHHLEPLPLIDALRRQNIQIVSLELTRESIQYTSAEYSRDVCLILGNETDGVEQQHLEYSDIIIKIPMHGKGKSLNVISSASVALYHIRHQIG